MGVWQTEGTNGQETAVADGTHTFSMGLCLCALMKEIDEKKEKKEKRREEKKWEKRKKRREKGREGKGREGKSEVPKIWFYALSFTNFWTGIPLWSFLNCTWFLSKTRESCFHCSQQAELFSESTSTPLPSLWDRPGWELLFRPSFCLNFLLSSFIFFFFFPPQKDTAQSRNSLLLVLHVWNPNKSSHRS